MHKKGVVILTVILIAVAVAVAIIGYVAVKPNLSPPPINKGSLKSFERDPCATIQCPQGYHCVADPSGTTSGARCVPDTHLECVNQACVSVNSSGNNTCSSNNDCIIPNETHTACSGNQCIVVQGAGTNQCASNNDCIILNETHTICSNEQCISVSGPGADQCSTSFDCGNQTNTTLPDLIVLSINNAWTGNQSGGGGNGTNQTFYEVTLFADIMNVGQAGAPSSTTRFSISPGGQVATAFTPALAQGQTGLSSVMLMLPEGINTATVNADWGNQIQESNENNNVLAQQFSVP